MNATRLIIAMAMLLLPGCGTYGSFVVDSKPPGAEILVDGEAMGKTPATIKVPFPENKQFVREKKIISVRLKGYKESKDVLSYEERESAKPLNFQLAPEPGNEEKGPVSENSSKSVTEQVQ